MKFDIYNLTEETITASSSRDVSATTASFVYLQPQKPTQAPHRHVSGSLYFHRLTPEDQVAASGESTYEIWPPGVWAKRRGSWGVVTAQAGCPWSVFVYWPTNALVVTPRRNVSSFLADMPDATPLSSLLLPGTHETMAFYGWPVSQCQEEETSLSTQLLAGIRVIDVRLAVVPISARYISERPPAQPGAGPLAEPELCLVAYHGVIPQRTPFTTILSTLHTFLTSPAGKSETVIMSLKQEDFRTTDKHLYSRLVREEIMKSPGGFKNTDANGNRDTGMWFLQNRIPNLGEVRGKVVLFSRFNGDKDGWEGGLNGMGMRPNRWPDSDRSGFTWKCGGKTVRTHDWYAIPSFLQIPEKVAFSTTVLHPSVSVPLTFPVAPPGPDYTIDSPDPDLSITFLSAAAFPLALPPAVAKGFGFPGWNLGFEGVNSRTARWLLEAIVPDLATATKVELHTKAKTNAELNTATRDGPVDPDALRTHKSRWFWQKSKKDIEATPVTKNDTMVEDTPLEDQRKVIPATVAESRRIRGWVLLDYYASEPGLVPLLIECNYRGRRSGQEGWP